MVIRSAGPMRGIDMTFDFGTLIAHLAKTRSLGAGTIVGVGHGQQSRCGGWPGKPVAEGGLGYSCIAEVRTVEKNLARTSRNALLKSGDTVRITMDDDRHHPISA